MNYEQNCAKGGWCAYNPDFSDRISIWSKSGGTETSLNLWYSAEGTCQSTPSLRSPKGTAKASFPKCLFLQNVFLAYVFLISSILFPGKCVHTWKKIEWDIDLKGEQTPKSSPTSINFYI